MRRLPPLTVPEVVFPAVTYADKSSGEQKTAMEGFTVPAQSIDAGCVIQYDAPGGCLGADQDHRRDHSAGDDSGQRTGWVRGGRSRA